MPIILAIIGLILCLSMNTKAANSSDDWDIDWPTSKGNEHVLSLKYKGCTTSIILKTNELSKLNDSKEMLDKAIKMSKEHYDNGCK